MRQELDSALKRKDSKRQQAVEERRAQWESSKQQPNPTQPTGAATATETVTLKWAGTVATGAAPTTEIYTRGTIYSTSLETDGHQQYPKHNSAVYIHHTGP